MAAGNRNGTSHADSALYNFTWWTQQFYFGASILECCAHVHPSGPVPGSVAFVIIRIKLERPEDWPKGPVV